MAAGGGCSWPQLPGEPENSLFREGGFGRHLGRTAGSAAASAGDGGNPERQAHWSLVVTRMELNREWSVHYPDGLFHGAVSASLCQADVPTIGKGHALFTPAFRGFSPQIPLWGPLSSDTTFSFISVWIYVDSQMACV